MVRDSIFISYSHKDAKWLSEVKKHLSILEHNHQLIIWDDTKLKTGSVWKNEILQSINRCKVAVLLVSNNFLASEFILKKELPKILKATKQDGITIFNLIIDTCAFHLTDLETFQCLNNPHSPLEELKPHDRKKVLVSLTSQLLSVIHTVKKGAQSEDNGILNRESSDFSRVLVLADIVKYEARTITDVQNSTLLRRKIVVESIDKLQSENLIEKFQLVQNKKPSTIWKASETGKNTFKVFETAYSNLKLSTM